MNDDEEVLGEEWTPMKRAVNYNSVSNRIVDTQTSTSDAAAVYTKLCIRLNFK